MRLIDADTVVTIQVYDDMTEETDTKKMTIAEAIDEWSDEGCPPTVDAEPVKHGHWIPVKYRPMDSEEREYWEEHIGEELADAEAVMFDCPMPEDGQEILVSYRKWISMDKCEIDDGCYGLEGNGDWDGVTAWMPQPKPYEVEDGTI